MRKLLQSLRARAQNRAYCRDVERLRQTVSAGDRVTLIRPACRKLNALVMNSRAQAYGPREAFVMSDDGSFSGWVSVENVFPEGAQA